MAEGTLLIVMWQPGWDGDSFHPYFGTMGKEVFHF